MYKCAKAFFDTQTVKIPKNLCFSDTDLFAYFKLMYGVEPVQNQENGFLKVKTFEDGYAVSENLFYNYTEDYDYYFSLPNIELNKSDIVNTDLGYNLSSLGYAVVDAPQTDVFKKYGDLKYNQTPEVEGLKEPYATCKFGERIWDAHSYSTALEKEVSNGVKDLMRYFLNFGGPLSQMDAFDLNLLCWKKGRSMEAHNGIDYKSFLNMITYNTEHCQHSRNLSVGEFDWYETTFQALALNDYDELMDIQKGKKEYNSVTVETSKIVLVNAFNPKFYHQVGEMKGEGELYVCTSNMSYRNILKGFDFSW